MNDEVDVVVVGSGASGSWAAKELSEQGLEVLVLEAGRTIQPEVDFPATGGWRPERSPWTRLEAAMRGQHVQARCGIWTSQTGHFFVNDRENPYSVAGGNRFLWFRGRQEGGRLHSWGRISPRMSNLDFFAASQDGHGRDWPISYEDLAPYYDRVEEFLGLCGSEDGLDHFPDGKYVAPWPLTTLETEFKSAVEKEWPERKVVSARILRQTSRVPPPLVAARETGRCTLRPDTIVSRIEVDPRTGKAIGVRFLDRESKEPGEVRSRAVVLCASTFESIRILLNSGSSRHPDGLGNSSGLLGRGIMENTYVARWGTTRDFEPLPPGGDPYDPSRVVGYFMPQFRNVGKRDADFLRGFTICGAVGRGSGSWWMSSFGSTLPRETNRVTIHRKKKDAWGIPLVHIEYQFHENDRAMLADQERTTGELIRATGLEEIRWEKNQRRQWLSNLLLKQVAYEDGFAYPGTAIHECGGAPMGRDPADSVLNERNQCWDAPNVFVPDGACFVTSPAVQLTNTIMAITVRTCDNIVRLFAGGEM